MVYQLSVDPVIQMLVLLPGDQFCPTQFLMLVTTLETAVSVPPSDGPARVTLLLCSPSPAAVMVVVRVVLDLPHAVV